MSKGARHLVPWVVVAAAVLVAGPVLLYQIRPVTGITAAFGSGAIALIMLAHLGVLAAIVGPLVVWRWRRHDRSA